MKDQEGKLTYGLEYALFFGVPGNKLELINGTSRWAFPFLSRAEGEAHFQEWLDTLRRWKRFTDGPAVSQHFVKGGFVLHGADHALQPIGSRRARLHRLLQLRTACSST